MIIISKHTQVLCRNINIIDISFNTVSQVPKLTNIHLIGIHP
ncbi:repressor [Pseudomonas savastanoi pv. retacarpa]|nr:repressor [Pseudomonas savastanoi pv. retacarpa]